MSESKFKIFEMHFPATYQEAREKLKEAEETSDLNSESKEAKRR